MLKKVFAAVFLLLACCSQITLGQRNIGIDWNVPANYQAAEKQLRQFSKLGISTLKIDRQIPAKIWSVIARMGFKVYVQLPFQFPVAYDLKKPDKKGWRKLKSYVSRLDSLQPVTAIGLFSFGPVADHAFQQAVLDLAKAVKAESAKPLYYLTTPSNTSKLDETVDFKIIKISNQEAISANSSNLYLYQPVHDRPWALAPVKNILERTANHPTKPLFFSSSWLFKVMQKHSGFSHTLSLYTHTDSPGFPLPKQHANSPSSDRSLLVLMLLFMWLIFAFTYNYDPIYQRSFLRYFGGHSFYVGDVMKRHIRNLYIGFSILAQHCISGGIAFFCIFFTFTGVLGQQAIYVHYPFLAWLGTSHMAIFAWGFIFTLATQILIISWLWIAHPKPGVFSQLMNLYPWMLQLNLITATLMTVIFLSMGNPYLLYLLGFVFLILFNAAFIITCFDTAIYVKSKKHWYLSGTLALYVLIVGGLLSWILLSPVLRQVANLASYLP